MATGDWSKLYNDIWTNAKVIELEHSAIVTYLAGVSIAHQSNTDGFISARAAQRLAHTENLRVWLRSEELSIPQALIKQDLWHERGHSCDRCPQPQKFEIVIHDYLFHQQSAEERTDLREKRRDAGMKGHAKRYGWSDPPFPYISDEELANAELARTQLASATASATASAMALASSEDTGAGDGSVASALADAERDLAREQPAVKPAKKATRSSATRYRGLPLDERMRAFLAKNAPRLDPDTVWRKFDAYAKSQAGPRADWYAAFEHYVLNEAGRAPASTQASAGKVFSGAGVSAADYYGRKGRRGA